MVRNEKQNKSYVIGNGDTPKPDTHPDAKRAELKYRFLYSTDRYHLVEVELLTGRHHQIRCQLSHIGCPIKGDLKYGAPRSNPDGGICLHARNVRLIHPVRKTELDVTAPVPSTWKGLRP
jgi:23S rRNA pseudouridine1911/1915/1917 synthase